jgi:hypothetical protein
MKQIKFLSFLLIASVFFFSCTKEGAQGPAGPAGATGATGAAGATGTTGATGATGTANVIYSNWATLTFAGSGSSWSAQITAPGVTQDIMDNGVVRTYFKFGSSVYEGTYSNLSNGHSLYQYLNVGSINLVATFNATYPWRYVIIPGGVASRKIQPDFNDYHAVCKFYNIPE